MALYSNDSTWPTRPDLAARIAAALTQDDRSDGGAIVAEATAGSRRLIAILCPEPYSSDLSRSSLHHLEERCKTTL